MATRIIDDTKLQNIAVAIQAKDNGGQMTVDDMPDRIRALISDFDMSVTDNQIKMLVYIDDDVANCYVNYIQTIANDVEVDWGDGTPAETSSAVGTGRYDCASLSHNYLIRGYVIIVFTAHNGIVKTIDNNGFLSFAGAPSSINGNQFPNNNFRINVFGISYGDNTDGNILTEMPTLYFALNFKPNISANNIMYVTLRQNVTEWRVIGGSIRNIKVPNTITSFTDNCTRNAQFLNTLDFTNWTIETLNNCTFGGTNMFLYSGRHANALGHTILLFATQEIAEAAKQKTNLAVYADWIKYEGEEY